MYVTVTLFAEMCEPVRRPEVSLHVTIDLEGERTGHTTAVLMGTEAEILAWCDKIRALVLPAPTVAGEEVEAWARRRKRVLDSNGIDIGPLDSVVLQPHVQAAIRQIRNGFEPWVPPLSDAEVWALYDQFADGEVDVSVQINAHYEDHGGPLPDRTDGMSPHALEVVEEIRDHLQPWVPWLSALELWTQFDNASRHPSPSVFATHLNTEYSPVTVADEHADALHSVSGIEPIEFGGGIF